MAPSTRPSTSHAISSSEAEERAILEDTVRPAERLKIGTELHRIGQEVGGMDDLEIRRDRSEITGASLK